MRKTFLVAAGCMALAAAIWASNDPWKDKPYQQWDAKDLQKIFQDSPWSHLVRVDAPWLGGGGNEASNMPTSSGGAAGGAHSMGGGGYGGGGGGNTSGGGDYGGGGGGGGQASFLVRWISSRTFREAMIRDRVLRGQMTDADAQTDLAKPVEGYEIVVTGPDMTPFQNMDENSLKTAATLTLKRSKTKLSPTAARFQKTQDGSKVAGVIFVFPAKSENGEASVPTEEKTADFSCTAGKFTLKWSFDVSKMSDSQGRDL
jgi:hypothetical protein